MTQLKFVNSFNWNLDLNYRHFCVFYGQFSFLSSSFSLHDTFRNYKNLSFELQFSGHLLYRKNQRELAFCIPDTRWRCCAECVKRKYAKKRRRRRKSVFVNMAFSFGGATSNTAASKSILYFYFVVSVRVYMCGTVIIKFALLYGECISNSALMSS